VIPDDLAVRPATSEDAEALVPLVYSSGPSTFDYVFVDREGETTAAFLLQSLARRGGEQGYGRYSVICHQGEIVGTGACYDGYQALSHIPVATLNILRHYGPVRTLGTIRRGLRTESVVKPPSGALHYLGYLGVAREWRGRGVGRVLIEHLLDKGRARGRTRAALDVSVENPRAQALYERLGFRVVATIPSVFESDFGHVAAHRRMEIELRS
jgi:ribosomal protein S18 acetylase RimI-like enzyme